MSSPIPPPPYSLQPPPYTRRQRKQQPREPSPPGPPRLSSREMLKEALKCARRAVKLDSITKLESAKLGSASVRRDLPAAVAAYDEAIAILQRVIARRSQKPGIAGEVERVTDIVSQPCSPFLSRRSSLSRDCTTIVLAGGRHPSPFFLFCS
jgi:hypothetical protein